MLESVPSILSSMSRSRLSERKHNESCDNVGVRHFERKESEIERNEKVGRK